MKQSGLVRLFSFLLIISLFRSAGNGQVHNFIDSLNLQAYHLRYTHPDRALKLSLYAISLANEDTLNETYILSLRNAGISSMAIAEHDQSLHFLNRALSISEITHDSAAMSACYNNLQLVYSSMGEIKKAKELLFIGLELDMSLKDTSGIAVGLSNLANIFLLEGNYQKALNYYKESAKLELLINNPIGAADSYNNMGAVYYDTGDHDLALDYFVKAYRIYQKEESKTNVAMAAANIASVLAEAGKGKEALPYILESKQIRGQYNDYKGIAQSYVVYAIVLQSLNQPAEAEDYFFRGMNLAMEAGDFRQLATGFFSQAQFYQNIQDTTKAILYYQNSLEYSRELGYSELLKATLEQLTILSAGTEKWEKAYEYQSELFRLVSDSNYVDAENQIQLSTITNDKPINESGDELLIFLFATICVLSLIILFQYNYYRNPKKKLP